LNQARFAFLRGYNTNHELGFEDPSPSRRVWERVWSARSSTRGTPNQR